MYMYMYMYMCMYKYMYMYMQIFLYIDIQNVVDLPYRFAIYTIGVLESRIVDSTCWILPGFWEEGAVKDTLRVAGPKQL